MNQMKTILILAASALLAVSCFHVNKKFYIGGKSLKGTGPVVSREIPVQGFTAIRLEGNPDVTFTQADSFKVVLHTQENVADSVLCVVEDGTLVVSVKGNRIIRAEKFDLDIAAPLLQKVTVQGASDFDIPAGYRSAEDLSFLVQGSGDLDLQDVSCNNLSIKIQGAGDVEATGLEVAGMLKVTVQGAGDVTAEGRAGEADLNVSGAGDIDIRKLEVAGEVRKHVAGAASIKM